MNKIAIIGTGYVGLVTGLGFAKLGHSIHFVDIDKEKIRKLKNQELPFFEPGLAEILTDTEVSNRVTYSSSYTDELKQVDIVFVCVQTPEVDGGGSNTSFLLDALASLFEFTEDNTIICIKSTTPPAFIQELEKADIDTHSIIFNPEFLREGSALEDFFNPDRIVIGGSGKTSMEILYRLYSEFNSEIITTDSTTALLIKYLSNTYLPMRLSFVNEAFQLGNSLNADIPTLLNGIGADKRIGKDYFRPSPGWGGSCFPKDTKALEATIKETNLNAPLINSINKSNEEHISWFADRIISLSSENSMEKIVLYGSAFKENTDDLRASPSIELYKIIQSKKCEVYIFDEFGHDIENSISDEESITSSFVVIMYPVKDIETLITSLNLKENKIYIPWENKVI